MEWSVNVDPVLVNVGFCMYPGPDGARQVCIPVEGASDLHP